MAVRSTGGRETVVYAEKYRKGMAVLKQDCLPTLNHTTCPVERVEMLEAGKVEKAGVRQEYQILKVYFKP